MGVKDELMRRLGGHLDESMTSRAFREGQGAVAPAVTPRSTEDPADRLAACQRLRQAALIPTDRLSPDPDQPRVEFDDDGIERLARSLRERGQLQPIRVRWDGQRWVIIAGERRWRAAQRAGLEAVACIMVDGEPTPDEVLEEQLIENCLREDLQPIEQARAFRTLMDRLGLSYRELAERLHLSHAAVHRAVTLLDLPEPVQGKVIDGTLSPSAAYEISKLDRPGDQVAVAEQAADQNWTRAAVVEAVKARKVGREAPDRPSRAEVRFDDGHRVTVTGPAASAGTAAMVELLRRAIRKLLAEAKERGEAA